MTRLQVPDSEKSWTGTTSVVHELVFAFVNAAVFFVIVDVPFEKV